MASGSLCQLLIENHPDGARSATAYLPHGKGAVIVAGLTSARFSARPFSAGLRAIQPPTAEVILRPAPISSAMGAPRRCARPPVSRLPAGELPTKTSI